MSGPTRWKENLPKCGFNLLASPCVGYSLGKDRRDPPPLELTPANLHLHVRLDSRGVLLRSGGDPSCFFNSNKRQSVFSCSSSPLAPPPPGAVSLTLIMWPLCMDLLPSEPPGGRFDFFSPLHWLIFPSRILFFFSNLTDLASPCSDVLAAFFFLDGSP